MSDPTTVTVLSRRRFLSDDIGDPACIAWKIEQELNEEGAVEALTAHCSVFHYGRMFSVYNQVYENDAQVLLQGLEAIRSLRTELAQFEGELLDEIKKLEDSQPEKED